MQETGNLGEWWIHVQTPTLKICSPVKVFKGRILWGESQSLCLCYRLLCSGFLLIGCCWHNRVVLRESWAQPEVTIFHLGWGPQFLLKNLKVFCYVSSFKRNQDPASWLRYCFLASPSLFLPSLPCLISSCLNLSFGTPAMSRRLKLFSCKQEVGNTERICTWEGPMGSWSTSNISWWDRENGFNM